VVSVLD